MNNKSKEEKEILKTLVVSEESTLGKLKDLVEVSKKYFNIEEKTAKVIINQAYDFTNSEKVELTLVGKYFAAKLGITNSAGMTISQLSDELGIVKTTLSAPLGDLVRSGNVLKEKAGIYKIAYHRIESILGGINSKH